MYKVMVLFSVLVFFACSSSVPSKGVQMMDSSKQNQKLADEWMAGEKMIRDGQDLMYRGDDFVNFGENLVDEGCDFISTGKIRTSRGETKIKEGNELILQGKILVLKGKNQMKEIEKIYEEKNNVKLK